MTLTGVARRDGNGRVCFRGARDLASPVSCTMLGTFPRLRGVRFFMRPGKDLFGLSRNRCGFVLSLVQSRGPTPIQRTSTSDCAEISFLRSIFLDRRHCRILISLLHRGGGVVLRNTPNIKGACTTGQLTCSVVNRTSSSQIRFIRFRRGCSCRSVVLNCQPSNSNFGLARNMFCHFYRGTSGSPSQRCFFLVSRVGQNGLDGVFNRLVVLVRDSRQNRGVALTCGKVPFCIPRGLCVVNVVGATSHDLTVVSCTLHEHFDFFRVRPTFASSKFRGCRSTLSGRAFGTLIRRVGTLGQRVAASTSLNPKFHINRDCFYLTSPTTYAAS